MTITKVLATPICNGYRTLIWKCVVSGIVLSLLTGVGWAFIEVRDMPKCYALKTDVETVRIETSAKIKQLKDDVNNRLERIAITQDKTNEKLDRLIFFQLNGGNNEN